MWFGSEVGYCWVWLVSWLMRLERGYLGRKEGRKEGGQKMGK